MYMTVNSIEGVIIIARRQKVDEGKRASDSKWDCQFIDSETGQEYKQELTKEQFMSVLTLSLQGNDEFQGYDEEILYPKIADFLKNCPRNCSPII